MGMGFVYLLICAVHDCYGGRMLHRRHRVLGGMNGRGVALRGCEER
jgi:hypothetical protein